MNLTESTLEEVRLERIRQDEKWGEQNHPSGRDHDYWNIRAEQQKLANSRLVEQGSLTWQDVLLEEVYEALAETDPFKRAEELIQVAAVATAEVEMLVRKYMAGLL